jgi:hypothetical protein
MKTRKIKFVANAVKWFDKVNGNTYHSVRIERVRDGKMIYCQFQYGYGDHYKYTALVEMIKNKWLPKIYVSNTNNIPADKKGYYLYERENNYPIVWNVTEGLKRDCIANGKE